ncbi:Eukaryotic translation initiation factor 4E transporter [Toxocara canis]|uniref:Eukaryotic translation initiation factor 4E transporter n=1 Tax=Toxocara canis TaxID=6265 RepID=A0A0B2UU57_TOXCA|nr:Eukaryotic translation initiation factor 4E transporter [Toxocara canis]
MSRRESESEDEKLKREGEGKPYLYTREQLLNIRMSELSSQRPSYLSSEFDNEEGKFVPEKWLEYRWICEGVENRPSAGARRKEKLKAEALEGDSTVLSPQRRAFSSGCRAASPVKNETESERLAANKGNWRSGAGFMMKNSSSTDFKPAFQKNAISSGDSFTKTRLTNGGSASNSNWRAAGDGAFRPNFHKDSLQGRMRPMPSCGEEKMPEWINEGPTSMSDMIELKGFDDEHKTKRPSSVKSKRETVASKQLQQAQQRAAAASTVTSRASASSATPSKDGGSRASSRGSAASSTAPAATTSSTEPPSSSAEQHPSVSGVSIPPDLAASMSPIFNGKLPNSDAEFAAIIGILGENDLDTLKQKSAISTSAPTSTPSVTGSRLSRFFATPLNTEHHNTGVLAESNDSNNNSAASRTSPGAVAVSTPSANAVLQKIFDSSPQRSAQSPAPPSLRSGVSVQGMMRVEDLERAFQREAACNASNLSTMQREAVTVDNEHLRALGLDANALNLNRHQLASSQVSKGNPLCDPHQQAHLMNRLSRFARQQEGGIPQEELAAARSMLPPTGSPPSPTMRIAVPHAAAGGAAGAPQLAGQAGMQETAHKFSGGPPPDAATLHAAAFMRSQYEAAALLQGFQALAANQQRAAAMAQPPQAADLNAMRQV